MDVQQPKRAASWTLLLINCLLLSIGNCASPLLMRFYFLHGGKRIWLTSWLQTGGWPINLIPLTVAYIQRGRATLFFMKPVLFAASAVIGVILGLDDYLYAYGLARLPVSTASLIIASQLGFTALFAFLLVKQKFTSYSINSVFLLTVGAGILALHTSADRPEGESKKEYVMGFVMTIGAALLYGFIMPLVELVYKKAKQEITYTLVLEIQMVMSIFATAFWKMPRPHTTLNLEYFSSLFFYFILAEPGEKLTLIQIFALYARNQNLNRQLLNKSRNGEESR